MEIKKILVVGAGVMGRDIAQVYAANGYETVLADIKQEALDNALVNIERGIDVIESEGIVDASYRENVHKNLTTVLNDQIPAMAKDFDMVAEAVYESKEVKYELFKMLSDNCREDCIFASDTSSMDVFTLTEDFMVNPERMITVHWFNPPHVMKIIEIVKGPKTSKEVLDTVLDILNKCNKKPVVLNRIIPGFIVNRLAVAICRELLYMVEQGVATPNDLNTALKYSNGLRWCFEGPFDLADFAGIDLVKQVQDIVAPSLCNSPDVPYWGKLVEEGKLGIKTGEGILGKYPQKMPEFAARRSKRILDMYKMMEKIEEQDKNDPIV